MAGLGTAFDPNAVKPDTGNGGGVHPAGIFEFEIQESDVGATSKGTGTILKFTAVGTGHHEAPSDNRGLKVWANINIANENAQAQAIGQGQLSALCRSMGFAEELEDSEQLHYQPFWAEVVHKPRMKKNPATNKYDIPDTNDDGSPKISAEFKRFMFEGMEEGATPAASPPAAKREPTPPPAQPATAPAGAKKRPWDK
jgi:hypothetical protein